MRTTGSIHGLGCGCEGCHDGSSRQLDQATDRHILGLLTGGILNHTAATLQVSIGLEIGPYGTSLSSAERLPIAVTVVDEDGDQIGSCHWDLDPELLSRLLPHIS